MILVFTSGVIMASVTLLTMVFFLQNNPGMSAATFRGSSSHLSCLRPSVLGVLLRPRTHLRPHDPRQLRRRGHRENHRDAHHPHPRYGRLPGRLPHFRHQRAIGRLTVPFFRTPHPVALRFDIDLNPDRTCIERQPLPPDRYRPENDLFRGSSEIGTAGPY